MSFARRQLFKHKHLPGGAGGGPYVSPYLLEILSTRSGAPAWTSATGTLTANTGQVVSCSRASNAYCLGGDGLLHLLGANTVRVEPSGLLVEGASTNYCTGASTNIGGTAWNVLGSGFAAPTVTLNSTDVVDPAGGNAATKAVFQACSGAGYSILQSNSPVPGNVQRLYSFYARTLSGTANINLSDQNGNFVALTITSTWTRYTMNMANGQTSPWFDLGYISSGGDPAISGGTVYLWGAQVEPLPFATSLIVTSGAAASRDGDVVSVANPLAAGNPANWSIGATLTALPGATVQQIENAFGNPGLVGPFGMGVWGANNSLLTYLDSRIVNQVVDSAGAALGCYSGGGINYSTPGATNIVGFSMNHPNPGCLPNVLVTTPWGAGSGLFSPPPSFVYFGSGPVGFYPFAGHLTDCVVDTKVLFP